MKKLLTLLLTVAIATSCLSQDLSNELFYKRYNYRKNQAIVHIALSAIVIPCIKINSRRSDVIGKSLGVTYVSFSVSNLVVGLVNLHKANKVKNEQK